MLAYAAEDTRHLLALRDALERQLRDLGRLDWANEEFSRLEALRWTGVAEGDTDGYLRVKGAKGLPPRGLAAFRELHRWRGTRAGREDKAPLPGVRQHLLLPLSKS